MDFFSELSWISIGQIILIDILLGGDNAIVIAMACRQLPPELRTKGLIWGTVGAIAARIILLVVASLVLQWTWVKLLGGALLYWIAVKMLIDDDVDQEVTAHDKLMHAIRTIMIADVVMSLDNVLAVASAAHVSNTSNPLLLMVLGVMVSIPFILFGSSVFLRLLDRFPVILLFGAGMLAYIAVGMAVSSGGLVAMMQHEFLHWQIIIPVINVKLSIVGLLGALSIIVINAMWNHLQERKNRSSK